MHNRFAKKLIESSLDVCVFAKQVACTAQSAFCRAAFGAPDECIR